MKIAFFEIKKWEEEYVRERLKGHRISFFKESFSSKFINKIKDFDCIVSFIYSDLNKDNLSKLPKLKFIATMSTGFNHIDMEYCKNKRISVSNVPFYGANTVAEHTFALILSLSRNIHTAIEKTRKNDFSLDGLMGFDLKGKTLGVIGPGNIGQNVIKIAKGFEMNVLSYGEKRDMELSRRLGFSWADLDNLLKNSDIITLHVPLNNNTKNLINIRNIKLMKKGAFLINTARGEIVDTSALLYGLDKKILAGAALDVLEGEEDIKEEKELLHGRLNKKDKKIYNENRRLLKEKNVIITPHCAFYTKEALERILDTTIDNINSFSNGGEINKAG